MKHFLFKIFIFAISVFLLDIRYVQTNYWKSENNVNKFDDIPYNITLANVGTSHGLYGLKYDVVPEINAWNFALSSQPYFYDYAMLNKYIDHFEKDAIVIIPISYFQVTGQVDCAKFRSRYYRLLAKNEMEYWTLKEYIAYCKFPIISAKMNILKTVRDFSKEQMSPYYGRIKHLEGENLYKYCVEKHKGWVNLYKENAYCENSIAISKIIDFCYAHNLRPVLITAPITDVLNNIYATDETFFPTFYRFSSDLQKKYPDLQYLDYSHNNDFSSNHELFADGDHLNNFGAEKFTKTLISDLKANNIL